MIETPLAYDGARRPSPSIEWLRSPARPALQVASALDRVRRAPTILEAMRAAPDVVRVTAEATREGVTADALLPPILETLEAAGVPRGEILILVATGMHRPNLGNELVEMLGPWVVENYRIENHHGPQRDEHAYLGETARGTPVWIDTRYVQSDLKVTTGLIEPHFMAGFSGGRKLVCPGLVGAVEAGALESDRTRGLLRDCLEPLLRENIDQLVLGCTHYPFLARAIQQIVGPDVSVIDPAPAVARQTERVLGAAAGDRVRPPDRAGEVEFNTTGEPTTFAAIGARPAIVISEKLNGSVINASVFNRHTGASVTDRHLKTAVSLCTLV